MHLENSKDFFCLKGVAQIPQQAVHLLKDKIVLNSLTVTQEERCGVHFSDLSGRERAVLVVSEHYRDFVDELVCQSQDDFFTD